ncbi:RNA methyltransferase [Methanosphaera sp.]|uniref:RNA methyltransferase n=1 Tax=Methanosphaera sp. TaxID=2666342 RepID=UPI0025EAB440|nr:RNA methyltransferase [Methanosphaera sp.]
MKIYTVFVEPKTPGNIGFLARSMKNFGLKKLVLINPCELENSAYYQASHARDVVQDAKIYDTLSEFIKDNEITTVVGTTGTAGGSYNIPRIPITPNELGKSMCIDGNIALLFGREGEGLSNDELELCDILVTIPTSEEYPIMNISHAAAIVFYEIYKNQKEYPVENMEIASFEEKNIITELCNEIISKLDYPDHKRKNVEIITKRIIGRAFIAGRESKMLRGTLKRINVRIKTKEE